MTTKPFEVLFCQFVLKDDRGQRSLIGLLNGVRSASFPTGGDRLTAFVSLRDYSRDVSLEFVLVAPDGTELTRTPLPSDDFSASPNNGHQAYVNLIGPVFPVAGNYLFKFEDRGTVVAQRALVVEQIPEGDLEA